MANEGKVVVVNLDGSIAEIRDQTTAENNETQKTLAKVLANIREIRDSRLKKTDWTANDDVTMSDEMKTYRQQLRDATNGLTTIAKAEAYTFPTEVLE